MFTGYGRGFVSINGTRHESHLLVTSAHVAGWDIGAAQRFPHPDLSRRLSAAGVGLEVMDSNAACRTYNVLTAEGRRVLAAILIDRD
jgi:uncharacterized protein